MDQEKVSNNATYTLTRSILGVNVMPRNPASNTSVTDVETSQDSTNENQTLIASQLEGSETETSTDTETSPDTAIALDPDAMAFDMVKRSFRTFRAYESAWMKEQPFTYITGCPDPDATEAGKDKLRHWLRVQVIHSNTLEKKAAMAHKATLIHTMALQGHPQAGMFSLLMSKAGATDICPCSKTKTVQGEEETFHTWVTDTFANEQFIKAVERVGVYYLAGVRLTVDDAGSYAGVYGSVKPAAKVAECFLHFDGDLGYLSMTMGERSSMVSLQGMSHEACDAILAECSRVSANGGNGWLDSLRDGWTYEDEHDKATRTAHKVYSKLFSTLKKTVK